MQSEEMIRTERFILRPFEEGDFDILHRLYGDAKVMRYTPFDAESPAQSEAHLARILADWQAVPVMNREYVICRQGMSADGAQKKEKIGRCHIALDGDRAMIGWLLVQEVWGQGIATEVAAALLARCFKLPGVREVYGLCHPDNAASRRVMEKCGMTLRQWRKEYVEYQKNGRLTMEDELEYVLEKGS